MRLMGFTFDKISVERFKDTVESLNFNIKIDIASIDPLKSDIFKTKEELVKVNFIYSIAYEPEFAKLELNGNAIVAVEPRIAREILRGWKDKETTEEFRIFLFNIVLRKSNIKALQLEDELGLPPHIQMPSINKDNLKESRESK